MLTAEVNGRPGQLGDLGGETFRELRVGVEPGADRRAALREGENVGQRHLDPPDAELDLGRVPGKLLAERHRGRVLEVGAADLDDVGERLRLVIEGLVQVAQRRQEPIADLTRGRDVHGGRKRVVRGLAAVDVVVRMHLRLLAELAAERLVGEVRDHLVGVHVGLGAGAGLPDHQRKLVVMTALDHLRRRARDGVGKARFEDAQILVHQRRRLLHEPERVNERARHTLHADAKVLGGALGLRAPVAVGRDLDRSEGIAFGAGCG